MAYMPCWQRVSPASGEAIEEADGFAQSFPEHKFHIVRALRNKGHIVGMTGDGVNDAPGLKQADVGPPMRPEPRPIPRY